MQDGHEYCEPGKPMCDHCKAEAYDWMRRTAEFNGHKVEIHPNEPARVDGQPIPCNDCGQQGAGSGCGPCPIKSEVTGVVIDEMKDIEKGPTLKEERRLAFVGALYAKAETSHLKRVEALIILQATLAEMLVPAIEGLKLEARKIEPFSIARRNADLMVEIAKELRDEALRIVDHSMLDKRIVIAGPRIPG